MHRLDRSARGAREEVAEQLVVDLALTAEVAADVVGVDVDATFVEARDGHQLIAQTKRHLVGAHDVHDVAARRSTAGWPGGSMKPWCSRGVVKVCSKTRCALAKTASISASSLWTTCVPWTLGCDARRARARPEQRVARRRPGAGSARRRSQRLERVEDRRQLLVLDVDGLHGGSGDGRRLGRHDRHAVADEAHAVARQERPVADAPAPQGRRPARRRSARRAPRACAWRPRRRPSTIRACGTRAVQRRRPQHARHRARPPRSAPRRALSGAPRRAPRVRSERRQDLGGEPLGNGCGHASKSTIWFATTSGIRSGSDVSTGGFIMA